MISDHELEDRLFRAGEKVATGPSMADKVMQAVEKSGAVPARPSRTLTFIVRAAAAILLAAAAWAGFYYLSGAGTPVFADIARAVLNTNTVTCKMTISGKVNGEKIPTQQFDAAFMSPDKGRTVMDGSIWIYNGDKMMSISPELKMVMIMTSRNGSKEAKEPEDANPFEEMRSYLMKAEAGEKKDVTALGTKTVDGRKVIGFKASGTMPMTTWSDVETKLPVTMEMTIKTPASEMTVVLSDFVWGAPLDEKLFSMDVPEGYTVKASEMDMSPSTEKDLLGMLKFWTSRMKGVFPPSLDMAAYFEVMAPLAEDFMAKAVKGYEGKGEGKTPAEKTADMEEIIKNADTTEYQGNLQKVARGIHFADELPANSDWHYVGKGVEFNAPDTPVFWYRPKDSKTYRVIYADLTVKDMPPEKLPHVDEP